MSSSTKFHKWELLACGFSRQGHITFEPTGAGAAEYRQRLQATASQGTLWRCLRCGAWVEGPAKYRGKPTEAPLVRRGKALREAFIMRGLALERFFRALFLLAGAYALYRFHIHQANLQAIFDRDLPIVRTAGDQLGYNVDSSWLVHLAQQGVSLSGRTLVLAISFLVLYGLAQVAEGVGLWVMKRWGEYLAFSFTAIFLVPEVYELVKHITVAKSVTLIINLVVVVYLLYSKRLFNLRGGKAAQEAALQTESLIEIKQAAA